MHNTAQKIIIDPINNEISTAIVMNNVAEDVSPLLLVGGEVIAGMIVMESFEVDCVVRVIMSPLLLIEDEVIAGIIVMESFEVDCVVVSDIKLSATASVDESFKVDCVVISVMELSVIADETLKVDCVVKIIGLLVMETLLGSIAANIKGSTVVLVILFSNDFTTTVV